VFVDDVELEFEFPIATKPQRQSIPRSRTRAAAPLRKLALGQQARS